MYVRFAQEVANLAPEAIITRYPQLLNCLDPGSTNVEGDARELALLLWRHSREVTAVLAEMIGRYPRELATGMLPNRSLLRLAVGGTTATAIGVVSERPRELVQSSKDVLPSMELQGKYWHVVFEGVKGVFHDRKGFQYLSRLLKAPHQELGASLLASGGIGELTSPAQVLDANLTVGSTFDKVLDADAEDYLRKHIAMLRTERDKSEDLQRQSDLDLEITQIEVHIAAARGLLGRPRAFPDDDERARSAVTKAIDRALLEIETQSPALYQHLHDSLKTGRRVIYAPRPPVRWDIAA